MSTPCECLTRLTRASQDAVSEHHHKLCPLYQTEKFPRLFYYEDAYDCWSPWPGDVDCVIDTDSLDDGETQEVEFKRVDMTDLEFDSIPEV